MDASKLEKELDESFSVLSEGMNEAEKVILRKQLDETKKQLRDFSRKSPEEQRRLVEEAQKDGLNQDDYQKMLEKLSPEERTALEKTQTNLERLIRKRPD